MHLLSLRNDSKGFTLMELIVSMGIAVTILSVLMYNQQFYSDRLKLVNLAHEAGLVLTEAQTYGIGVKAVNTASNQFSTPYGLLFSFSSSPISAPSNAYYFFSDKNNNSLYDTSSPSSCSFSGSSECLERIAYPQGYAIHNYCLILVNGSEECASMSMVDLISITFSRPNPEARIRLICSYCPGTGSLLPATYSGIKIIFRSPKEEQMAVAIYQTGQISVREASGYGAYTPMMTY